MYAAAANRAAVIELLAAKGADLKATSKVTDLSSLTREGAGFGGNPQVPGGAAPGQAGGGPPGRPQAAPEPGAPRAPGAAAGHRSQLSIQRDDRRPRRPHAVAVCHAPGLRRVGRCAAQGRRRCEPDLGRRQVEPAADGGDQRPLRHRADLDRQGCERQRGEPQRRDAALRRAERRVGAEGALSAAARAHAAEARLSRPDEAAARQGRRPERAPQDEGVVLGLQLRPVGRRRDWRDRVLARRLRERRRGDAAAGRRGRRSRTCRR